MIYAYGITQQGTYHVKNGTVCQDAHKIIKCSDSCAVAAVADGLGSEEHSDIASRLAADRAAEYCAEKLDDALTDDQILEVIHTSFALAQSKIEEAAADNGHELDQYDTTLSLAVLRDGILYYGHSGDSGIVALTAEGFYTKVTEQQRDEEGRVFPLYFGDEKWVFARFPEPVASVFLATDGMLETLFPVYIRNEPVSIYVALARYFMDGAVLRIAEVGEQAVREKIEKFLAGIPDAQVNDDKTVAVLINPDMEIKPQPAEYYAEPDWCELKRKYDEAWKRAAYPHLFQDQPESADTEARGASAESSQPSADSPAAHGEPEKDQAAGHQAGGKARISKGVIGQLLGQKSKTNKLNDQGDKK